MQKVTGKDIKRMMVDAGWIRRFDNPLMYIMDREFFLPAEEEVLEIIDKDDTDEERYVPEYGDCDNFAFELRHAFGRLGWAVGVLIVKIEAGMHAIFFYCTDEEDVVAIEPQTDSVFDDEFKVCGVVMC